MSRIKLYSARQHCNFAICIHFFSNKAANMESALVKQIVTCSFLRLAASKHKLLDTWINQKNI